MTNPNIKNIYIDIEDIDQEACYERVSNWDISESAKQWLSMSPPLIERLEHGRKAGVMMLPQGEPFELEMRLDGICCILSRILHPGDLAQERIEFDYI